MSKKPTVPAKAEGSVPRASSGCYYNELAALHSILGATGSHLGDDKMLRKRMKEASFDLYVGLQPKDALDATLATLLVSVANASLNCLSLAAQVRPECLQHRDLNLRHGLKGALVAAELAKAYEARRNKDQSNVRVGTVNIDSGAQAIVGNVQMAVRNKELDDKPSGASPQANKRKK